MYKTLARLGLLTGTLLFGALTAAPAHATAAPAPRELGTLGGHFSRPTAINDHGVVVGTSTIDSTDKVWHGFIWQRGKMRDIGDLSPNDINNRGHLAVTYTGADGASHAGIWRDGQVTDLGVGGHDSGAAAINDKDEIVGTWGGDNYNVNPFLWRNGTVTNLSGGHRVWATDINDKDEIVGGSGDTQARAAVVWRNGEQVGICPGGRAASINERGEIVGASRYAGFLWRKGTLVDLPSAATGINDHGVIVGSGYNGTYRWRNGKAEPLDLDRAVGINNRGQIIGIEEDANHGDHGVILG